jgi:multisubunit Na+/H+ antiporter MnhB subunit
VNELDILIWIRLGAASLVINLSFATQRLYTEISEWYIDELNATGSDYKLIRINIRT